MRAGPQTASDGIPDAPQDLPPRPSAARTALRAARCGTAFRPFTWCRLTVILRGAAVQGRGRATRVGGDAEDAVAELFSLDGVILAQPRRPILRSYHGPRMNLSSADGTVFGHLHKRGEYEYTVRDLKSRALLSIDLVSGAAFGRPLFQLADGQDRRIGEVQTQGRVFRTRLLHVRTEGGTLRLTRNAPMGRIWLVEDDADVRLGRVTVSTVRSFDGLQQYAVELDQRAGAGQGRLIVAAVVCLQVVRRWIDGSGGSPA